jgi:FixJ family two-component response regulator
VRESLRELLQSVDKEVLSYASGEALLRSGQLGDINCVISDFGLPGMNGIELLRAVHAIRADIPIIIITARPEPTILTGALASGAYRAFTKPVNSIDLLNAIASIS